MKNIVWQPMLDADHLTVSIKQFPPQSHCLSVPQDCVWRSHIHTNIRNGSSASYFDCDQLRRTGERFRPTNKVHENTLQDYSSRVYQYSSRQRIQILFRYRTVSRKYNFILSYLHGVSKLKSIN